MSGIRLLVCGGRNFQDRDRVFSALDRFLATWPVGLLIHGAVRGADKLAGEWAKSRGIPVRDFPADWDRYRRAAGPRRNQQMLDEGRPHGVTRKPLAERMLDAARQPYCTDVIPLTEGAEAIQLLHTAIRAFLDAEHAARWTANPSDARVVAEERRETTRDALVAAVGWKVPAPPRKRVQVVC
jgi:hypothetical protein